MQIGQRNVMQQNAVCGIDRNRDVGAGLPSRRECGVGAGEQPVMQLDSVLPRREVRDRIAPKPHSENKGVVARAARQRIVALACPAVEDVGISITDERIVKITPGQILDAAISCRPPRRRC
jgi:hypothetical protein